LEEIAREIEFIAHERDAASVLFSDICGFTSLAGSIAPEDVVAILNVVFSTFDVLTSMHQVYKVETIGDAYMACSGVVTRTPSQTKNLVDCALAFQESTKSFRAPVCHSFHFLLFILVFSLIGSSSDMCSNRNFIE
jgi:class 3 adenylate cyclase